MDTNNQKLIDRFLLGQLNANEEAKFLGQLETDQAFKSLYEASKEEFKHMELMAEGDLRNQMNEWSKEGNVEPVKLPHKKFPLGKLLFAIAALVGIALISFYVLKPKADPIMMAEAYYDPDFSTVRAGEGDAFDDVMYILEGRKESSYATLRETLAQIPKSSENYFKSQYYLGHIAYFEKDFGKAKQHFQLIPKNSEFRDKAEWYQSLSSIHLGDQENYFKELRTISEKSNHAFRLKATELLKKLQDR